MDSQPIIAGARILGVITACTQCPHRHYYTSGMYECLQVREILPKDSGIPRWCPLPHYPVVARQQQEGASNG